MSRILGANVLIVLGTLVTVAADEPASDSASARFRNERQAAQARPAERAAILKVTRMGANVILGAGGGVENVVLEGCVFADSDLAVLHAFPDLKRLQLGHSKVSDAGLRHVKELKSLESLTLIQTNTGDKELLNLEELSNLKSLTLHMSLVTDAGMHSLAKLKNLAELDLENTVVGDAGLAQLSGLTNLRKLLVSRTKVTDAGLAHLSKLTNLRDLALYHNAITDDGLRHLRGLTNLKVLDLEGTKVTDAGLSNLRDMSQLETLNLRYTGVTTRGLRQLAGLKEIKRLWTDGLQLSGRVPDKEWQVWLGSAYGDDLYVYELGSFKLLKRIEVGPNLHGLSATADGRTIHVALEHFDDPDGELVWVDTTTFAITGRVKVGPQPNEQECTPDGKWIYVPCSDGHWYVVDGEKREVVTRIHTGGRPHNTVVSPDGKRMYLSPMGYPHAVTIVDVAAGHRVIGEIPYGDVVRPPAITSDERYFFQNIDNMLGFQVADIAQRRVVKTVQHAIPPARREEWSRSHGLGVRPDQKEIWSCDVEHQLVHVHETTSGNYEQIATITLPGSVYWLTFSPDSRYAFVSIRSKWQVAVVDCLSKQIVTMLDGGHSVKRTQVVGVPLD